MTQGVKTVLQTELLNNWFEHTLAELVRVEPLPFFADEQWPIRTATFHVDSQSQGKWPVPHLKGVIAVHPPTTQGMRVHLICH